MKTALVVMLGLGLVGVFGLGFVSGRRHATVGRPGAGTMPDRVIIHRGSNWEPLPTSLVVTRVAMSGSNTEEQKPGEWAFYLTHPGEQDVVIYAVPYR